MCALHFLCQEELSDTGNVAPTLSGPWPRCRCGAAEPRARKWERCRCGAAEPRARKWERCRWSALHELGSNVGGVECSGLSPLGVGCRYLFWHGFFRLGFFKNHARSGCRTVEHSVHGVEDLHQPRCTHRVLACRQIITVCDNTHSVRVCRKINTV